MVPPPDNVGDEFPDFDSMTPEEQMSWLESLAKRQGVSDEELTTQADFDIPIPEDVEIDEPGYVPFEGSASARRMKEKAEVEPEPEPEPEMELEPEPAFDMQPELELAAEIESESWEEEMGDLLSDDEFEAEVGDSEDPMRWLDSLSAQPGEDMGEIEEFFAEVPMPDAEAAIESDQEPELDEEVLLAAAGESDPLNGVDPMLFLESLAKRQGASLDELTTSADLELADVAADVEIDEPGYVPFEGSASARRMKEAKAEAEPEPELEPEFELEPEPELELEPELEPELEFAPELESLEMPESFDLAEIEGIDEEEFAAEFDLDLESVLAEATEAEDVLVEAEYLDGADPMTWLESLAKRQGASVDELTTSADLEIPELPEDTVIDEPGYVEYSPFGILPPDQAVDFEAAVDDLPEAELPEMAAAERVPEAAFEGGEAEDEALSWLEDLAAEPDEDLADLLAFDESEEIPEGAPPVSEPEPEMVPDGPLAGMTDEEIAYAQAHGELTPHQELAWLKRQAAKLAEVRESQELAAVLPGAADVPPAEPVEELPDWLVQMRDDAEQESAAEAALLAEEADLVEVTELAGLFEESAEEADLGLGELAFDDEDLSPEAVDSLWAEQDDEAVDADIDLGFDSELAAFLQDDFVPVEPDQLAEALDAEFDRKLAGDDSEPEWYTDAVAHVAGEAPLEPEMAAPPDEVPAEGIVAEAVPVDMPDWLKEADDEIAAVAGAMPGWLGDAGAEETTVEGDMPDWLVERMPEPETEEMPDWLSAFGDEAEFGDDEAAALDWIPDEVPEPAPAEAPVFEPESIVEAVESAVVEPEPEALPAPESVPPVPVAEVAPEISAPAPVVMPEGELFETYRQRLEENPNDHASRLALARALHTNQKLVPSLDQYEALIDTAQLLQDVSTDLTSLVKEKPDVPRIRRLLGDTYMRQGLLQEALDAYRSALNQL